MTWLYFLTHAVGTTSFYYMMKRSVDAIGCSCAHRNCRRASAGNFLLFVPERISRGVIGPLQRSRNDGRSDRADGESPAGEREESDHSCGGDAADARANQVTEVPGNASFPAPTVTGDESVAGFIPVPFDPNRNRPTTFTKSGKPLRKIRQHGLPVLAVKFPGPWRLLATRPAAEKWWR